MSSAQFAPLQAAICERCIAQGKVEAALDQVELHIGESHVEPDTGM